MTAQPHEPSPGRPARPEKNVLAIRAVLSHPCDIEAFEASLPVVVDKARATHDWAVLDEFIHTWWLIACDSLRDPRGRHRMWERVGKLRRGESVKSVPGEDVEARIRARLARGA
ncbi:DUF6247 family protein [Acrocarpospora catenulata]|uniref:DUF6247 family protein n=1 Tax=Acrocarpospora catenulata TaxID=2836182 RepID=UPI003556182D